MQSRVPLILLLLWGALFFVTAVEPYSRAVWIAEMLPIVGIVLILLLTYRSFQFSPLAYLLMSVLIFLHTVGAYYTFERVPFGVVTELFGWERNHYDRFAHFTVGFYAYAIAEFLVRKDMTRSRVVLYLFPIFAIFTVAAAYEIIEWLYAVASDPAAGAAFLGSRGDVWDAQKDMLADGLGGILAVLLFAVLNRDAAR